MTAPPLELVLLDVNETLLPLDPVAARMAEVGLDGAIELWFTRILRDGFAAAAADRYVGFRELAAHHLAELLRQRRGDADDTAVAHVLAGFDELVTHPDVATGLATLQRAGIPAVALTNGSGELTRAALERSGLAGLVAAIHDVSEVGRWKPAPDAYRFVLDRRGVVPAAAAMVAAHPWDLLGAEAAGLVTAWLDRDTTTGFPEAFGHPAFRAATLDGLAHQLVERGRS